MSVLEHVLFPDPSLHRTPLRLLWWWESRRIRFNAAVAAAGVVTTGVFALLTHLHGMLHGMPIPWPLILVYGVMANLCYSSGWVVECLLQRWFGWDNTYDLGPALFRNGLAFSVGLTLFPMVIMWMAWLFGPGQL
jgi:hypothetical protein